MKVFISYCHYDAAALKQLNIHLAVLRRDNRIAVWFDREILAGGEFDREIESKLQECDLFLLLVTPDFLASNYCCEKEMEHALRRHERGTARVLPIIVQPCDWLGTPLKALKAVPRDGKAVSEWRNKNSAYMDVVQELRRIVDNDSLAQVPAAAPTERVENPAKEEVTIAGPSSYVLLHGRDIKDDARFDAIRKRTREKIDREIFAAIRPQGELPPALSKEWIKTNRDIYTFLMANGTDNAVGYINAMPITDDAYGKLRTGALTDPQVQRSDIVAFGQQQILKLYLMSIAIDPEHRRAGDGLFQFSYVLLFSGLIDKLAYYARQHRIRISHLLAVAWTPEGIELCTSLGMSEVGTDEDGDFIFEMDIATYAAQHKGRGTALGPLNRLLKIYEREFGAP